MSPFAIGVAAMVVMQSLALVSTVAHAQVAGAAERAAARAAANAAERRAAAVAAGQSSKASADRTVRRWSGPLCKTESKCPLPPHVAKTFTGGGSYNEVILHKDTMLHRVYADPARRLGPAGERYSYWSRSDEQGIQAQIDRAINPHRYGNTAELNVSIQVPRGTRVFEGRAAAGEGGRPVGGGNQVVVENVQAAWVVTR